MCSRMDKKEEIAICILTKNAGELFNEVLLGIEKQKTKYELNKYLVDSGSIDDTIKIGREHSFKVFKIEPINFHHAKTKNFLVSKLKEDYCIFLSQDAIPYNEEWLSSLLKPLEKHKEIISSYSRQIPLQNPNIKCDFTLWSNYPELDNYVIKPLDSKNITQLDVFSSNVSCCYRSRYLKKYLFPEFAYNAEDQFWTRLIMEKGYKTAYVPFSIVVHYNNEKNIKLVRKYFDHGLVSRYLYRHLEVGCESQIRKIKEYLKILKDNNYSKLNPIRKIIFAGLGYILGRNEIYIPYKIKKRLSSLEFAWSKKDLIEMRNLSKML